MYTKARRKTPSENIQLTLAEKDTGQEEDEEKSAYKESTRFKQSRTRPYQSRRELSTSADGATSLSNLSCKTFTFLIL